MKRSDTLLGLAAAVLLFVNAYGAISGFPVMDDGELLTTAREAGAGALIPTNRDRPVNAWLIHASYSLFGERRRLWAATAAVFWAAFAWQTARFVRRLLPDSPSLAGICALLVLAPLVVEMQHTTLTYVYAAMLPTILAFEALLATLRPERDRDLGAGRIALGAALVAVGALVSEYSVAVVVPAVVFLAVLARRLRPGRGRRETRFRVEVLDSRGCARARLRHRGRDRLPPRASRRSQRPAHARAPGPLRRRRRGSGDDGPREPDPRQGRLPLALPPADPSLRGRGDDIRL
jgi:hypothetical protein